MEYNENIMAKCLKSQDIMDMPNIMLITPSEGVTPRE